MQAKEEPKRRALPIIVSAPLIIIVVLLLIPLTPLLFATYLLFGIVLQLIIWVSWCTRGVNVLLVYSESPNWHDYVETRIIPRLPASAVVLNWSHRRKWKFLTLPVIAFRFFGGSREFNPLVVVFQPFRWAKTYRFWKAFKDFKHGKSGVLDTLESELFEHLSRFRI